MRTGRFSTLLVISVVLAGCAGRNARYLVIPANPHYLLRSPNGQSRAFPDTTASFSNAFDGWVDLQPGMTLKLERAYFDPPESRNLRDYIGVETTQYRCESESGSLRQSAYAPLPRRPEGQPPVTSAMPSTQLISPHHRFFFQVVVSKESGSARAVLLSGDSQQAIAAYTEGLTRGDGCAGRLPSGLHCVAIPEATSASLFFEIIANGNPLPVLWGSTVAGVVGAKRPVKLQREYGRKTLPVELDPNDANALRLPLLPGDVITFGR